MARKFDPADLPPSPDLCFECELWAKGFAAVAGLDEAGRGAWAGPVSAGAVIFPPNAGLVTLLPGVRDSKQMTPSAREFWAGEIRAQATAWAVGFASNVEIDALGIVPATRLAMQRAVAGLTISPEYLLIDALLLPGLSLPQMNLIKGDARALSIAAASVLAKTARDAYMRDLAALYPGYDLERHKGYGTAMHAEALEKIGPCAIHRYSFAPVRQAGAIMENDSE